MKLTIIDGSRIFEIKKGAYGISCQKEKNTKEEKNENTNEGE